MIQPSDVPAAVAAAPSARALLLSLSAGALLILLGIASNNSRVGNDAASDDYGPNSLRRRMQAIAAASSADVADDTSEHVLEMTIGDAPVASSVAADDSEVDTIALLGERHSGTNWITNHLQSCFGDELKIQVSYSRYKHWFQYDTAKVKKDSHVVVAMFRDPYDWTEAMRERPHHAHEHIGLSWRDFVTKPWVGPRNWHDAFLVKDARGQERVMDYVKSTCLANFTWNEVIPCDAKDSVFVQGYARYMYELNHDGSGKAYPSIVDLRREKILNFLTVPDMKGVKHFYPYRYEELSRDGTSSLIETLETATGKKAKCTPFQATGVVKHKRVDPRYVRWMNQNVDWEVEGRIGYTKRQP